MKQTKTLARMAGVLYLIVGIFGGFAEGWFQPLLYVAGDAAATAARVAAHAALMPWGVAADLAQATVFVFLGLLLRQLLRPYGEGSAGALLTLVIIAAAIMTLNNVFEFAAFRVATDTGYRALDTLGRQTLIYLLLDIQHYGLLIAQIFFGLWLVPLGLLTWESKLFPRWLGALLVTGGVCYLVNLLTLFLTPTLGETIKPWIVLPCASAEISMVVYLLVFGARKPRTA